jgi:hypothetical protein
LSAHRITPQFHADLFIPLYEFLPTQERYPVSEKERRQTLLLGISCLQLKINYNDYKKKKSGQVEVALENKFLCTTFIAATQLSGTVE